MIQIFLITAASVFVYMTSWFIATQTYTRILKVARTIADLDGSTNIHEQLIAERFSTGY